MMIHERRLVLAIVLKKDNNRTFYYNDLEPRSTYQDNRLATGGKKSINLNNCFAGYSEEETLGGDDQWYCNICREHRDISKKLEIYTVPKIMVIQLKRFQ